MNIFEQYDLFLLDFDGLLANTEEIHYKAYRKMCQERGYTLDWNFEEYCEVAHYSAFGLEKEIYKALPGLQESEPKWSVLYKEKTKNYLDFLSSGQVDLMPGVPRFLKEIENKTSCVVTHSAKPLVDSIRAHNSILNTIDHWITREDYVNPKPASDGYVKAIELYGEDRGRIVGFEDTPRGMRALMGAEAQAVMVTKAPYPEIKEFVSEGALHFPSFDAILDLHQEKSV